MKILSVEKALEIVHKISVAAKLNQKEETIFDFITSSINTFDINGKTFLRFNDLKNFLLNFSDAIKQKDFSWLTQKRGLKVDKIVSIEEFIKSSLYLRQAKDVRPAVLKALNEFWEEGSTYIEAICTGGIGIGKNFFAQTSLAYMLYKLSCYYNPQLEFGLSPGSSIILIQQSKTERLAKKVLLNQFGEMLKKSPYFKQHFMFDVHVRSELRFPNNIYILPAGGADTAALGLNVFGGILDELNFMERVEDSVHTKFTGEDEYDQAERMYTNMIRRIKSRFMEKGGKIPGKLISISSRNYTGDFTDRKMKEAEKEINDKGHTSTYIMNLAQWESIPTEKLSEEKFFVELGDDSRRSRIIKSKELAIAGAEVVAIPIDYLVEFERDLDGALKDIGGIVVGNTSPFIPYKELIIKAQDKYQKIHTRSLFRKEHLYLSTLDPEEQDWESIVDLDYIKNDILNVNDVFACHIDVGLNKKKGDAAGLSIGRIFGYTFLPAYKYYDPTKKDFVEIRDIRAPIYHIDGALQVRARKGDEIDLNLVRDLIMWLRGHLNLKWGTLDTYQSVMMIQAFRRAKMRCGVLSVDTSIAPYTEVKMAIKDERIYMPPHKTLNKELREIERTKDKIDHPKNGSKDVSDSVAGVIYILQHKEANYSSKRGARRTSNKTGDSLRRIRTPHSRSRSGVIK